MLLLHDASGMTRLAIAAALNLPLGTVSTRLRVARQTIDAARRRFEAQLAARGESLWALPPFALLFDISELSTGGADEPLGAPGVSTATPPLSAAAPWMAAGFPVLAGFAAIPMAAVVLALCDAPTPSPLPIPSAAIAKESAPPEPSPSPIPTAAIAAMVAPPVQSPRPRGTPPAAITAPPRDDFSPDEVKAQVNAARVALARGDAVKALFTLERLDRRDRRGLLLPYRESLRIEALANLGRLPEARARLLRLRKATPADPLLVRLDRLLRAPAVERQVARE